MEKKIYSAPILSVYGDLKEITQGAGAGVKLDADFPICTKRDKLTFFS